MAKKTSANESRPLLELLKVAGEERDDMLLKLKTMVALPRPQDAWRGVLAVPPGSLLETILADFRRNSDIPLEIPFFSVFALLAGHLLHSGVKLEFNGTTVDPDIWLLLLAPSGSSKSLAFRTIEEAADTRLNDSHFRMDGIQSDAALFDLLEQHNKKLGIRDEFNEFYKQLRPGGTLEKCRDLVLRIYDHAAIERNTHKEGTRRVNGPSLCIIGMTVRESFCSSLTPDDMINGLAQRFLPVIALRDPGRPMTDFPIYHFHSAAWKPRWAELLDSIQHTTYIATSDALTGYETTFRMLFAKDVDPSFFRRVMWAAHKYALIYHVLCGRGREQRVGPEAYGWAARVLTLHLADLREMLFSSGLSPLQKTLQKTEALIAKLRAERRPVTARALVTGVRDIRSVAEARSLLQILSEQEDPTEAAAKKKAAATATE